MNREQYMQRMSKFPEPLHNALDNNIVVRQIAEAYGQGRIIHYEEALAQMVVQLSKDWSKDYDRYVNNMINMKLVPAP